MNNSINRQNESLAKRGLLKPFVAVLALLLLFLQSTELAHTHAETVQQYQCEICVKAGAGDDFIAESVVLKEFASTEQVYQTSNLSFVLSPAPSSAQSRAPPQA